ncbi:hypothetical protein [Roseiflexus sp.]|uniref:hypothetical protein n=1 Tax=Roseiflexus sp. TaxID=2562120 RepID=UPI0021DD40BA|nr:hypothetical protein [Roseiflexus sp.]GIW00979.1 MAG: hypothetical protein KatS3mg058_2382 [Roseiflexus sp.]
MPVSLIFTIRPLAAAEKPASLGLPVTIRHGHPEQREGSCATRLDSSLRSE